MKINRKIISLLIFYFVIIEVLRNKNFVKSENNKKIFIN